jgi:hypothetical protein
MIACSGFLLQEIIIQKPRAFSERKFQHEKGETGHETALGWKLGGY